jgi:Lon protease-like protein
MDRPAILPLFPLPNVVLFPKVLLPLHIFEPRYREMVADALDGDRILGMVLLRPGWERNYEGRPPIFLTGCTGVMTHVEQLPDGRYNLVLRGIERFRVLREDHELSYRRAIVQPLAEGDLGPDDREAVKRHREKLEVLLASRLDARAADPRTAAAMSDEDLVNALAQYLDLEPLEKQALLEHANLKCRAESLVELLEMKIMIARTPGLSNIAH